MRISTATFRLWCMRVWACAVAILRALAVAFVIAYAGGVVGWLVLRALFGDTRWWWLALANTFALYLFVPLLIVVPIAWLTRSRWALGTAAVPLIIFLWLFGEPFIPHIPSVQAGSRTLTVMTFNVWGFNYKAEAIAGAIQRADPDIVVLQELNRWLADDLEQHLHETYPYSVYPQLYRTSMQALFSRYPISSSERVAPPGVWRQALHVVVDVDGRRVHVVNLHLTSTSGAVGWRDLIWRVKSTYSQREREARLYHEFLAGLEGPVIVAGDFNATDQTTVYRILTQGLQDAYRIAGWGLGHTYPARPLHFQHIPIPVRLLRIDYILYSPDFNAEQARVGPWDGVSDHLPVVARLRLR